MQTNPLALMRTNWKILTAATMGWALDAFDMTIFFFLIPDLAKTFHVDLKTMALIPLAMGGARLVGTIGFGAAADKWGRKLPLMISILWFCLFSGLSGLAWSYASLLLLRILFGIGYGGEWGTATSLLMESLPKEARALASGLMMAGYEMGFLLSAFCFKTLYPVLGWRWMFFIGVLPALLAIFIRKAIPESPEWLESRRKQKGKAKVGLTLNPAVFQGFAFVVGANFLFYGIFALYPTFLIQIRGLSPADVFPFVAMYSVASIVGKPVAGLLGRRFGERPVLLVYMALTVPITLLYTFNPAHWAMMVGAILIGLISNSIYGIVPTYLSRRFTAEERGLGLGIASGFNSLGAVAPFLIAVFTTTYGLEAAMTGTIMISAVFTFIAVSFQTKKWLAVPEEPTGFARSRSSSDLEASV
ncbi:MFS transporter [Caballeronia sp. LZ001]|uniref:MFS transporter n=1 Tax=Caballeronia sp. LZ001 TaxID=3038553 RepID=UPI0028567E6F|nr:MFS transporter [Caballeronia sp. LZ001]MDR5804773.1 MFS transporter [Caballeronia sp. LZ001]